MGTSSGSRILSWCRIVLSASCPRSSSSQSPSAPRLTRFLAAFPLARRSPIVADRSCSGAGEGDGQGGWTFVMEPSCPGGSAPMLVSGRLGVGARCHDGQHAPGHREILGREVEQPGGELVDRAADLAYLVWPRSVRVTRPAPS